MAIEGNITSLYADINKTEALFPRTKVGAVSDANNKGLDAILKEMNSSLALKADESFVINKINQAQLGGGNTDVDLSVYATKDEVASSINNIDFPVDSVNGKTGNVNLSAADVEAAPVSHSHSATDITGGILPVEKGGTGVPSLSALCTNMFMEYSNSSPTFILTYSDKGTYTAPKELRNTMGLGNTTGALPIANGGTGATTAAAALTKLGITATAAELNYVDGVTSKIQTQLNGKIPAITTYYSSTKSADDLDVPLALIPCSTTSNAGLYKALGSSGYAYVLSLFYNKMDATANRVQLGFSYNTVQLSMAMRKYTNGTWTEWVSVAGTRLAMGTEYITDELYNNKPVYTMLFNGGTISDGAEIDYPSIANDTISVIDSRCTIDKITIPQRANGTWGTADAKSTSFACYMVKQNSILVSCGTGMAGKTIYIQIWYTKN